MNGQLIPLGQCHEAGCRRATRPDHAYCDDHRVRWEPEWVRRARQHRLPMKEYPTGGAA